ncbi:MAG: hypothetical protein JKY95_19965 [Planctomycetaceae bacterium]|nr:hypothetical protein [Planctomycetaceae bacterium]
MSKLVAVKVTYMQCDAKDCDYITHDVNNDTVFDYRNKPCPKCGENLLTDADWEALAGHLKAADMMSDFLKGCGIENSPSGKMVEFARGEMDGKGNTIIKFKD